jgi:hypothetical protein
LQSRRRDGRGDWAAFFVNELRDDPFRCWLEDSGHLFAVPFRFAEPNWPTSFFYAGNASRMRALFDSLGGFDEMVRYDLGDDFAFSLCLRRGGVRSHFCRRCCLARPRVDATERIEALRRSGEAARYITELRGPVPEWQAIIAQPQADIVASARRAEERERVASTADTRAGRYQALLDLAFAQGYHASAGEPGTEFSRGE